MERVGFCAYICTLCLSYFKQQDLRALSSLRDPGSCDAELGIDGSSLRHARCLM